MHRWKNSVRIGTNYLPGPHAVFLNDLLWRREAMLFNEECGMREKHCRGRGGSMVKVTRMSRSVPGWEDGLAGCRRCFLCGCRFCLLFCRRLLPVRQSPATSFTAEAFLLFLQGFWRRALQTKDLIHRLSCLDIVAGEPAFPIKRAGIFMFPPI
jgi:hypothetical protein